MSACATVPNTPCRTASRLRQPICRVGNQTACSLEYREKYALVLSGLLFDVVDHEDRQLTLSHLEPQSELLLQRFGQGQ